MFQFPGLLGYSRLDARWAAPPDLSQPSTPDLLMTPRHPPRALRSLTTPIGPPLLLSNPGKPEPPEDASTDSTGIFTRSSGLPGPASRDAAAGSRASHVSVRVRLTTVRATSRRAKPFSYCTVVEIATHPILRAIEMQSGKPDPLPPHAGVCFVCDQHRIAKKHRPEARLRREGGSRHGWFLVWPGGEAVKHGPAPRSAGTVDCIDVIRRSIDRLDHNRPVSRHFAYVDSSSRCLNPQGKPAGLWSFPKLRNGADVALLMPGRETDGYPSHSRSCFPDSNVPEAKHLRPSFLS